MPLEKRPFHDSFHRFCTSILSCYRHQKYCLELRHSNGPRALPCGYRHYFSFPHDYMAEQMIMCPFRKPSHLLPHSTELRVDLHIGRSTSMAFGRCLFFTPISISLLICPQPLSIIPIVPKLPILPSHSCAIPGHGPLVGFWLSGSNITNTQHIHKTALSRRARNNPHFPSYTLQLQKRLFEVLSGFDSRRNHHF